MNESHPSDIAQSVPDSSSSTGAKEEGEPLPEGPILVSACLAGRTCAYDGNHRANSRVLQLLQEERAVLVCPEAEGGLSTPRPPAEIMGGTGLDVLEGRSEVRTDAGVDVTGAFLRGAQIAAERAQKHGCKAAILKARSPSCGRGVIFDGSFTRTPRPGDGVAAAMLVRAGLVVMTEEDV